ncbi:replication-associated recombination protein A [Alicyclobacillus dauci]|uniref:Replication-associated recombination protein A n=1 Tax=Alicyclobacillus dauci TaxID=1475485 RepID=A0ABY6Z6X6_9BACL|nr:replication-associated recombination protein A [Alicyclobacillus dauci]WAH38500.1 replication-associated recombination protein A [Alicyclobacillus dauci]
MDLFSMASEREQERTAPLAYRMRPTSLDEVVGQQDIVGPGKLLRRMVEADRLQSIILYGPPGTGKTTLAEIIANQTKARFQKLNAVTAGVADIRKTVEAATEERSMYRRKTVLFVDEIHRFNKSQQDALLPHVEGGLLVLVGATTENPYFEVNSALVSRSHIFHLEPLKESDIIVILRRALEDRERGLGNTGVDVSEDALHLIATQSGGDARRALNVLELASLSAVVDENGQPVVGVEEVREALQSTAGARYDKSGDEHYDTISAFIKSVRGSDPDAALLWLAKMLAGGEDPAFIARRLMILASEDVGNADPFALPLAVAGWQSAMAIGMPEARIMLGQVTTYLATAPKSNAAYKGINAALKDVESGLPLTVPPHLRGTGYRGAEKLGHGIGYKYPHDYKGHYVEQNYWPVGVEPRRYYDEGEGTE